MPPFTLAPWELPPDYSGPVTTPADFVFRAPWQSGIREEPRETEIWARRVMYKDTPLLFFCDGEHPDNGNWVLTRLGERVPFFADDQASDDLVRLFQTDWLWRDCVQRFVFVDTSPQSFSGAHWFFFYIATGGFYCLIFDTFKGNRSTSFHFCGENQFPECATTMKNQLLSLLNDDGSEARFALNWLHLTFEQQREKLLRFQRGDLSEMKTILRAALQSQTNLWQQQETLSWRTCDWHPQRYFIGPLQGDHLMVARYPQGFPIPERLERWKRTVWDYFRPSLDQDLLNFAQSCRLSASNLSNMAVEVSPPTAHEHLEALLTLRDWWQQNFPDQSFEQQNADESD